MVRYFGEAIVAAAGVIISASGLAGPAGMIAVERHAQARDRSCNQVVATIPAGTAPRGIAVNLTTDRVYVADIGGNTMTVNDFAGTISVIDGQTNEVTATIPVGVNPQAATVNPGTDTIYVTNFVDGTVSVIDGQTNQVTTTIDGVRGARDIAFGRRTGILYVTDDLANGLWVINARANTVTTEINLGSGADSTDGIAANPTIPAIYVPQENANAVQVVNGQTNAITSTFAAGRSPAAAAITVSRRLGAIYVTDLGRLGTRGTVSVISQRFMKIKAAIRIGKSPEGIAVDGITRTGYAINEDDGTVSVLALCG